MKITIKDNYLKKDHFQTLSEVILSHTFPWFFQNGVVSPYDGGFQFTHQFYSDYEPKTEYFGAVFPIFQLLGASSIVRSKANLLTKTEEKIQHPFHTDFNGCITSILYLNTNNGKTIFEDGTEVESIANRMITFDSDIMHTGTTCTDENSRVLINFNYHI